MISDKIRPHHLERKALLYVRQSSAHQVLHNRGSSALQYAMQGRLTALDQCTPPPWPMRSRRNRPSGKRADLRPRARG